MGRSIRKVLLDGDNPPIPMCELLLFFASQAQHIETRIRPALERGATVICDRFTTSTLVYQGLARGLGETTVMQLSSMIESITPDLALVLDVDPDVALARVEARGNTDRMDQESLSFHRTVRMGFLYYAEMFSETHRLIESDADAATVSEQVMAAIDESLGVTQ